VRCPPGLSGGQRQRHPDQILAWDNELFREDLGILPDGLQQIVRRGLVEFLDLA